MVSKQSKEGSICVSSAMGSPVAPLNRPVVPVTDFPLLLPQVPSLRSHTAS